MPKQKKEESTGFSTEEVEKEAEFETPSITEAPPGSTEPKVVVDSKPEMPLQSELMELTKLEIQLVDKYHFTPSQIVDQLHKMFGESEGLKLTRAQTKEAMEYFKGVMGTLDSESPRVVEFKK